MIRTYSQTKNHIFFFQMFWKDGLSKKLHWNMIFLVLSGKMFFFLPENIFFRWSKNERWFFPRNTWKYDTFGMYVFSIFIFLHCYIYFFCILPFCQKKRIFSPRKIYLKVIDILDWHSRKNSLYSYEELRRCFHILHSSEKKQQET